jgi:pimeloyl-ACP methyl ester carboxylesterase
MTPVAGTRQRKTRVGDVDGVGVDRKDLMTTDWTFDGTWPFEPKWFDSVDGRMHYVDEGPPDGNPVVMMHGNPTWGYLYRNFIGPVTAAGHRAIVPDHLGFGRSDKPDRPGLYTIRRHAERLEARLESLDLSEVTVVCQDWGGPTSLYWATRHPPHPMYASRTAVLAFPREIPAGPEGEVSDLNADIESGLETHFRR